MAITWGPYPSPTWDCLTLLHRQIWCFLIILLIRSAIVRWHANTSFLDRNCETTSRFQASCLRIKGLGNAHRRQLPTCIEVPSEIVNDEFHLEIRNSSIRMGWTSIDGKWMFVASSIAKYRLDTAPHHFIVSVHLLPSNFYATSWDHEHIMKSFPTCSWCTRGIRYAEGIITSLETNKSMKPAVNQPLITNCSGTQTPEGSYNERLRHANAFSLTRRSFVQTRRQ